MKQFIVNATWIIWLKFEHRVEMVRAYLAEMRGDFRAMHRHEANALAIDWEIKRCG